jgi:YggT family protein
VITEPMLKPLRRIVPPFGGMIDVTPVIAWFVLSLAQGVVVRMI